MIRTAPIDVPAAWRRLFKSQVSGMRLTLGQMQRYMRANAGNRLKHFLSTSVVGIAMFNLFLITDWLMLRDVFDMAVKIRLCVLTPVVSVLVIGGHFARGWWLRHASPWAIEYVAMVGTMMVACALGFLLIMTTSEELSLYRSGFVPILVFGNLVQRLPFRMALVTSLFIIGIHVTSLFVHHDLLRPYQVVDVPLLLLLLLVALYSLVSNFNLEMDERQDFLQTERTAALRDELERTNQHLQRASSLDPLTGLANRRQFDQYVSHMLHRADGKANAALVALLIDVDHFKAFNDRYGHPAGDQCLRLVAAALQTVVAGVDGFLARWGGEEFVVLLPLADISAARGTAEAMRQEIESLAMRHELSTTADHVTISLGLARSDNCIDPACVQALLKQADQALYLAKGQGRNRCVVYQRANA